LRQCRVSEILGDLLALAGEKRLSLTKQAKVRYALKTPWSNRG
jgi:hypothetical protein